MLCTIVFNSKKNKQNARKETTRKRKQESRERENEEKETTQKTVGQARKEKARKQQKRTQGKGNHNSTAKIDVDLSANGIYTVHSSPMTCISIIPRI